MLKEFLDEFTATVKASAAAKDKVAFIQTPESVPGEGWLINGSGEVIDNVGAPVKPRQHQLHALRDVETAIQWAAEKRRIGMQDIDAEESSSQAASTEESATEIAICHYDPLGLSVWHDPERVTLIMDDDELRVNSVTLDLETTEAWRAMAGLEKSCQKMDHRTFMSLLRFVICPLMELHVAAALLEAAKVIDFGGVSSGTSAQSRNQSGFGLDIQNSVKARAGEIPDEVTVMVSVYTDPLLAERWPLKLNIEIDPVSRTFKVLPAMDELPRVMRQVQDTLSRILHTFAGAGTSQHMATVFHGSP